MKKKTVIHTPKKKAHHTASIPKPEKPVEKKVEEPKKVEEKKPEPLVSVAEPEPQSEPTPEPAPSNPVTVQNHRVEAM